MDPTRATLAQAYLPAFSDGGLLDLPTRLNVLRWAGFGGIVTQPVTAYRPDALDGPYSPLSHTEVDPAIGEGRLREITRQLESRGITMIGDFVANHLDTDAETVRSALASGAIEDSWLRVARYAELLETWDGKVNIFNLPNRVPVPDLGPDVYRASTFYHEQVELDFGHPEVIAYLLAAADVMIERWGYQGLRLDAIAYAAGKLLTTPTGENEALAWVFVRQLREHLTTRATEQGRRPPLLIAEAGGATSTMSRWLRPGVADATYDFTWMPTLVHAFDRGDWQPLLDYWATLPDTAGWWLRFLSSHDERQLRYVPFGDEIAERHGGPDGRYLCFGGAGLTLPVRRLAPSEEAFVAMLTLTVLSDGLPLVYQTDWGGWGGVADTAVHDPRDPNRCRVPWLNDPHGGWRDAADKYKYPLDPEAATRSVQAQMMDTGSVLSRLAQLIRLRRDHPAFTEGPQIQVETRSPRVAAFARASGDAVILVVANAGEEPVTAAIDASRWRGWRVHLLDRSRSGEWLRWTAQRWISPGDYEIGLPAHAARVLELIPPHL